MGSSSTKCYVNWKEPVENESTVKFTFTYQITYRFSRKLELLNGMTLGSPIFAHISK